MEIKESVIVTIGSGIPHVAAIGVIMEPRQPWLVRPYPNTQTLANLRATPAAWLNFVDEAWPIVAAALGQGRVLGLTQDPLGGWRLTDAIRCIRVTVTDIQSAGCGPPAVMLQRHEERGVETFFGINRAFGALIEACVAATRVRWIGFDSVTQWLERADILVDKTGSASDRRALALIRDYVAQFPGGDG